MITDADLSLLSRPLLAMITVAPSEGRFPSPRPVWFEATPERELQFFSFASTARIARLRELPRASAVVAAPVGEPEHWVVVEGAVSLHEDGAQELAARLGAAYWADADDAQVAELDTWTRADLLRLVIHPEKVQRYAI